MPYTYPERKSTSNSLLTSVLTSTCRLKCLSVRTSVVGSLWMPTHAPFTNTLVAYRAPSHMHTRRQNTDPRLRVNAEPQVSIESHAQPQATSPSVPRGQPGQHLLCVAYLLVIENSAGLTWPRGWRL